MQLKTFHDVIQEVLQESKKDVKANYAFYWRQKKERHGENSNLYINFIEDTKGDYTKEQLMSFANNIFNGMSLEQIELAIDKIGIK